MKPRVLALRHFIVSDIGLCLQKHLVPIEHNHEYLPVDVVLWAMMSCAYDCPSFPYNQIEDTFAWTQPLWLRSDENLTSLKTLRCDTEFVPQQTLYPSSCDHCYVPFKVSNLIAVRYWIWDVKDLISIVVRWKLMPFKISDFMAIRYIMCPLEDLISIVRRLKDCSTTGLHLHCNTIKNLTLEDLIFIVMCPEPPRCGDTMLRSCHWTNTYAVMTMPWCFLTSEQERSHRQKSSDGAHEHRNFVLSITFQSWCNNKDVPSKPESPL